MNDYNREKRIEVANQVLATFAKDVSISHFIGKGYFLSWTNYNGKPCKKRISFNKEQKFAFTIVESWTILEAIKHLVWWCQNKPCYPLSRWEEWASKGLWRTEEAKALGLRLLKDNHYPKFGKCIFCGKELAKDQWDWFVIKPNKVVKKGMQGCGCYSSYCIEYIRLEKKIRAEG